MKLSKRQEEVLEYLRVQDYESMALYSYVVTTLRALEKKNLVYRVPGCVLKCWRLV